MKRFDLNELTEAVTGADLLQEVMLPLYDIRLDGGTQPRAQLDQTTINSYAEDMQNGDSFPAVVVFYDGKDYWLADGFHRWHATMETGKDQIRAQVKQGTQRDAVLHSVGVNSVHGLRRTNLDKRRAVMRLLHDEEWVAWSDREIARHCRVSHPFVASLRSGLSGNDYQIVKGTGDLNLSGNDLQIASPSEPETRKVQRGGTVYEQQVSSKKRREAAQKPAPVRYADDPDVNQAEPARLQNMIFRTRLYDVQDVQALARDLQAMFRDGGEVIEVEVREVLP